MTSLGQLASSQVRRSRSDPGFEELHPRRRRPELSRVTVLVGRLLIDVGVPSRIITSAVANDVIELANDQLPARTGLGTPSIMLKAGGRSRASRAPSSTLTVRWRRSAGGLTRFRLVLAVLSGLVHQPYRPVMPGSVAIGRQGCEATKHAGDIAFCSNIAAGP